MADQPDIRAVPFNHSMQHKIFSPPNMISIIRIITIPFIYWSLKRSFDQLTLVMLGLAFLSDAVDGYIARRFRWQSDWGLIMDPLADKLLVGFLAVFLVIFRDFPIWMAGLIIFRDLAILGAGVFLFFRPYKIVVPSNRTGKMTMIITSLAMLLYIIDLQPYGLWCIWLSVVGILSSTFHYGWGFYQLLKHPSSMGKMSPKESSSTMDRVQRSGTQV